MARNPIDCFKKHAPDMVDVFGQTSGSRQDAADLALKEFERLHGELEEFKAAILPKYKTKAFASPDVKKIRDKYAQPQAPVEVEEKLPKKKTNARISKEMRIDSAEAAIAEFFLDGGRIKTEHINRYGDRNKTSGTTAIANYGKKDGEYIDTLAARIADEFGKDEKDIIEKIIDFIHENPSSPKKAGEAIIEQQKGLEQKAPEEWNKIPEYMDRIEAGESIEDVTKGLPDEIVAEVQSRLQEDADMGEIESQLDDNEIDAFNNYMEKFEVEGEVDMDALTESWEGGKRGVDPEQLDLPQDVYNKIDNLINQHNERKAQKSQEVPGEVGKGEVETTKESVVEETNEEIIEETPEADLIDEDIESAFAEFADKRTPITKTKRVAHGKGFLNKPIKVKPTAEQKAKLSAAIKAAVADPTKENKAAARDAFIDIYESPYTGSKQVQAIWKQLTDTFPEIKEAAVTFEQMVTEAGQRKPPSAKLGGIGGNVPITNLVGQQTADLGDKVKFDNTDAEERFGKASGSTKAFRSAVTRVVDRLRLVYKDFTKKYPYLNYKENANVANKLREFDGIKDYAKALSEGYVKGLVTGLTTDQYDLLRRGIILKDLQHSIESGTESESNLPFGFTSLAEVNQEIDKINQLIDSEPDVKAAFELREGAMEKLHDDLVKAGLISDADYKGYFHRRTLKYLAEDYGPETVYGRTPISKGRKGFQKGRTGSKGLDYSTNFVESEFKVVAEAIYELERKRILDEILAPYKKALKDFKKQSSDAYKKALGNVEQTFGKTSPEYKEFEDGKKAWRLEWENQNIPDGQTIWQPIRGNNLFKAMLASEEEIEGMLSYAAMTGNIMGQSQQFLKAMAESISKDYVVLGGKKTEYLIPEDIAETLEDLGTNKRSENAIEKSLHQLSSLWKINVLLNPRRFFKYNLNNLSGDMDGLIAADARILKKVPEAFRELKKYSDGEMTPLIQEALKHSVINSGLSVVEFADINETDWVKYLTSKNTTLQNVIPKSKFEKTIELAKNPIESYFNAAQKYTNFRENIFRLAAFIQAKENIAAGKTFYWSSQAYQIKQIEDDAERAAKLAREVLGDYGNISAAGEWLRKHLIPFYSWVEINMGRYFNLTSNAIKEGKIEKGMLAKGVTLKAAQVAIAYAQMAAMLTAIKLWNRSVHGDCDKRLRASNMDGMYVIVGKNADGTCKTIPIQGAFQDFLQKFGLKNIAESIEELMAGKTDAAEVGAEVGKAPIQEVVNGLNPFLKAMYELPSGQSLYPDVFNPRRIRDRGEYLARMIQMQDTYKAIKGMPMKDGYLDPRRLENFITYDFDPDEIAYYAVKNMITKEMGGGFSIPGKATQEKSDALYYYKQALRYKDTEAADRYLTKYYELGGMDEGMKTSIRNSHPLHGLKAEAKRDIEGMLRGEGPKTKFGETLTEKDLIRIRMAINYYDKTFPARISK